MKFRRDLIDLVKNHFSQKGISYKGSDKAEDLAARYREMRIRHFDPAPRQVHFSNELNYTLSALANETDSQERGKALEAWNTVFHLWHLFTSGGDLTPYLSKNIKVATSSDGLLWDYGMHHFHLGSSAVDSGFIRRSGYLLFAMVGDQDAYFVDVRKHHDPQDLLWVRQDLLNIVHANWPEITNAHVIRGVSGSNLTDQQKKELRRKNVISAADLGGEAIAPLGWGTMADGSSMWCRWWATKLLWEIDRNERILKGQSEEIRANFAEKGMTLSGAPDCRLVLLNSIDASPDLVEQLLEGDHLSKGLYAMGFAIVEATSGYPVIITQTGEA